MDVVVLAQVGGSAGGWKEDERAAEGDDAVNGDRNAFFGFCH